MILSICIPTYNREKSLQNTLACLAKEIEGVHDEVEICVSDNASPDHTQEVLKKWESRIPLVHSRNETNIGYDRNILRLIDIATGDFIWYMGDDDSIFPGSVKTFIQDLKASEGKDIGAVYINARIGKKWITRFSFDKFRFFKSKDALPPIHVGFLGCVCIERMHASNVIKKYVQIKKGRLFKRNFNENVLHAFAHMYLFLECMKASGRIAIAPAYGVEIRAGGEMLSYAKKVYLSLIIFRYIFEIKKYYPWFKESYPLSGHIRSLFSLAAISSERPEFENAYDLAYRMLLKIMELEGNHAMLSALKGWEIFRKTKAGRYAVIKLHDKAKRFALNPLDKDAKTNEDLLANLDYVISDTERLLS